MKLGKRLRGGLAGRASRKGKGTRMEQAAPKKKKSLVSKAHKLGKKIGKHTTKSAALGLDPVTGAIAKKLFGKKKKSPEQILSRRSKRHEKAVKSGNAKKIAKSERKNEKSTRKQGKRLMKRERKNPGSTERRAAKRATKGKRVSGAMGVLSKASAAKKATPGARNPAAKAPAKAAAPSRGRGRRRSGLRR